MPLSNIKEYAMKKVLELLVFVLFSLSLAISCTSNKEPASVIKLPSIFSDNMVLQANKKIQIWGEATPNSSIEVWIDNNGNWAESDDSGYFQLELDEMKYGGPYDLFVSGKDTIVYLNVMLGEVWLCSGQSNMQWTVNRSNNAQDEIAEANYDNIRLFTVPRTVSDKVQEDCDGEWSICNSENIGSFSAVGYFFGREVHKNLNVAIGLIHSSWGGTPIESWMKYKTLESDEDFTPIIERHVENLELYPEKMKTYNELVAKLEKEGSTLPMYHKDTGDKGLLKGYAKKDFDDSNWKQIDLPSEWEVSLGVDIDGAFWFRKSINIPEEWDGKDLVLELGSIDDFDITYFNGKLVGKTTEETPNYWSVARKYDVPSSIVNVGEATIAIRVFDHYGAGGFTGGKSQMKLYRKNDQNELLNIAGKWKYKIENKLNPSDVTGPGGSKMPPMPRGPGHSHSPAGLYNAMINPVAPYTLNGFIWYQGETNAGRAFQYRKLLPAMINDWRELWNDKELYFGIVQLANFMAVADEPTESAWAELREAQDMASKNVSKTGLAVTIDIGEADDIHPRNKQDVGRRLAYWALNKAYNQKDFNNGSSCYSGPTYKSMKIEENKIRLRFDHIGEGLAVKGGEELIGFSISGQDNNFVWANAEIINDEVVVWSEKVSEPVAIRYAWANNPICNLYNSAGLPAVPFRTDSWTGVTDNVK